MYYNIIEFKKKNFQFPIFLIFNEFSMNKFSRFLLISSCEGLK